MLNGLLNAFKKFKKEDLSKFTNLLEAFDEKIIADGPVLHPHELPINFIKDALVHIKNQNSVELLQQHVPLTFLTALQLIKNGKYSSARDVLKKSLFLSDEDSSGHNTLGLNSHDENDHLLSNLEHIEIVANGSSHAYKSGGYLSYYKQKRSEERRVGKECRL